MPASDGEPQNLSDVADAVASLAGDGDEVSVGEVQEAVGRRSFAPLLLIMGLVALSPIGGIPGVPTLFGLIVLLTAGQLLLGRRSFWLPAFVTQRSVDADRLERVMNKVKPVTRWVDRLLRPRLTVLTGDRGTYGVAIACTILAFGLPVLEIVPMAAALPAAAITAFSLALVANDGLLAALGYVATAASLYFVISALTS